MPDSQNDQPHECENEKQKHKTGQAGYNIVQIHISGVRDSLPDLDRKGQDDHDGEDVDPGDDKGVPVLRKRGKQRMDDQQQIPMPSRPMTIKCSCLSVRKRAEESFSARILSCIRATPRTI